MRRNRSAGQRMGSEPVFTDSSYEYESNVLQYFGNMRYNLSASDVFVVVVKVTNHTGFCDAVSRLILSDVYSLDLQYRA